MPMRPAGSCEGGCRGAARPEEPAGWIERVRTRHCAREEGVDRPVLSRPTPASSLIVGWIEGAAGPGLVPRGDDRHQQKSRYGRSGG